MRLKKLEKELFDFSCIVASINWEEGDNTKEWLDHLRKDIDAIQKLKVF